MDLTRLLGDRIYRIDLSSSKVFKKIDSSLLPDDNFTRFFGCAEWIILSETTHTREYYIDGEYSFLLDNIKLGEISKRGTRKKVKELKQEFDNNRDKICDEKIENTRDEMPAYLNVIVSDTSNSSCTCHARCMPILYEKIGKNFIPLNEVSEFQVQNAQLNSLRFLDSLFIGVLNGKIIEETSNIPQSKLVVNDSLIREISDFVDALLDRATGEVLICGWVGTRCVPKLRELESKGVKIRIITHQPSEARNQPFRDEVHEAFTQLCIHIGKENICTDENMHGRMIIVDDKALIGSMDLNSSSLTGPHTELAIYTEQTEIVLGLRNLFNSKFKPLAQTPPNHES